MTVTPTAPAAPALTPTQQRTLTEVLNLQGDRPTARLDLVGDLRRRIEDGTRDAIAAWPERSLFLSKAQLGNVQRCEGLYKHTKEQPRTRGVLVPVAQGTVVHRAIQHCYTHPHLPVEDNVRSALEATARLDGEFATFWRNLDTGGQSDLLVNATAMVMTFLDSWPPMPTTWSPRFEFGMQARVGNLTLSGRVDLMLGRARADHRQTMVVADWKSGSLYPEHEGEADFYALLAALRFNVPPFRSFVYSLASGETTRLDVDEDRLVTAADTVVAAVNAIVEVMGNARDPRLSASAACAWCPARDTCPEALAATAPSDAVA